MTPRTPARQDPRVGVVLQERYRIVRKIGDGGMGSVYEGTHLLIKRRVAIKILHPQYANNPEIAARFQREAEAATSIGHPNIVEVTDMGTLPDGAAYMVLEFLEGRDWSEDIDKEGPQPLGKAAHILCQVCDALTAAHAKGIIHRDLKPENVYLVERGDDPNFAKVVDFGISKMSGPDGDHSLTRTGTALGTPYYMSPEQCQGKKDLDRRADIYSMGVMLFQALTGQYPFDDESYPMLVLKICTQPAPNVLDYRRDLPPEIQGILQRMLAKDREHRYGSAAEVKAALAPYRHLADAPVLVEDAPRTSNTGPTVLEGAVRAMTPTGTARLDTAAAIAIPPSTTPYPLTAAEPSSGRGLVLGIAAMFALLLASGATLGLIFAFSGDDEPMADTTETGAPPPAGEEDPAPADEPATEPTPPAQGQESAHVQGPAEEPRA